MIISKCKENPFKEGDEKKIKETKVKPSLADCPDSFLIFLIYFFYDSYK